MTSKPEVVSLSPREHAFYQAGIAQGEGNALKEQAGVFRSAVETYGKQIKAMSRLKRLALGTGWLSVLTNFGDNLERLGNAKRAEATKKMTLAIQTQAPSNGEAKKPGLLRRVLKELEHLSPE